MALLDAEGSLGTEDFGSGPGPGPQSNDTPVLDESEAARVINADDDGVDVDPEGEAGTGSPPGSSVFAVSGAKLLYLGHYGGSLYLNERVRPGLSLPEQWSEFKALAPLVKLHWHPYISSCAPARHIYSYFRILCTVFKTLTHQIYM